VTELLLTVCCALQIELLAFMCLLHEKLHAIKNIGGLADVLMMMMMMTSLESGRELGPPLTSNFISPEKGNKEGKSAASKNESNSVESNNNACIQKEGCDAREGKAIRT
jgi:hypothetical protein